MSKSSNDIITDAERAIDAMAAEAFNNGHFALAAFFARMSSNVYWSAPSGADQSVLDEDAVWLEAAERAALKKAEEMVNSDAFLAATLS